MNFIETGLPHTEFVPTKKEFSPRRLVPMSGLSKKYMGLESMSKSEMGSLIDRLSQPKKQHSAQQDNAQSNSNAPSNRQENMNPSCNGRFIGRKRMSKADMQNMIARLSNSKPDKTPDSKRTRSTEEWTRRGVTASYAWQGKGYLRNNTSLSYSAFVK